MVNNIIVILSLIIIGYLYLKARYESSMVWLFCLCILAPVLTIGDAVVNSAYLISAGLLLILAIEAVKKRAIPRIMEKDVRLLFYLFIISRIVSIAAYLIGYLQNGTADIGVMVGAMAGNVNLTLLVLLLVLMGKQLPHRRILPVIYKAAAIVAGLNLIFFFLQRFAFDFAYNLTAGLYLSPDRSRPLLTMLEIGAFDRIFGTFFTPTLMGTTFLYLIVILAAWYFCAKVKLTHWPVLLTIAVLMFVGINSFSKLIILGVPAMLVFFLVSLLFLRRTKELRPLKLKMSNFFLFSALTLIIFTAAYFLFPAELINVKNYYYGMLIQPLASMSSRYQPGTAIDPSIIEAGEPVADAGMTVSALLFFRQHPVFGVGPVAVGNEFIGDSQIAMVLHHGGIVGAIGYLLFYAYAMVRAFLKRNLMVMSLIAAIFIGCTASGTLDYRHTMPFIAFIILVTSKKDSEYGPDPETHKLGPLGEAKIIQGGQSID